MEFRAFADRAATIEAEDADLEKQAHVESLLSDAGTALEIVTRFVQGRVFPAWSSRTLDVGTALCYGAIARAAGPNVDADDVEVAVAETGEVGAAAEQFDFGTQQGLGAFGAGEQDPLTVQVVDDELRDLAAAAGDGSEDQKRTILFGLFNRCSPLEARYLARLVLGEMRIGVAGGTVRDAIAGAFDVPEAAVARALQVSNDYGLVARNAREEGVAGVRDIRLKVGRPIQAMLAQAGTVTGALADWGEAAVEVKYDGARVQVHHDGEEVRLFSRNMEDVTDALPEVADRAGTAITGPAILDGEVLAIDESGAPLPFQEILRRFRRKHDVAKAAEDVAVELHYFDCMHAPAGVIDGMDSAALEYEPAGATGDPEQETLPVEEGKPQGQTTKAPDEGDAVTGATTGTGPTENDAGYDLLDVPYMGRRAVLEQVTTEGVVDVTVTDDPEHIEAIDAAAIEDGHEGIMLKNPAAVYTPGRRGMDWRKRKPDVETLDLIVTGAEWGEGRRANLLGTFEVAVRDGDTYRQVGNVATGLTDEELESLTERLEPHIQTEDGQAVTIEPAVVLEVGYEEIQQSPTYDSGYALRFPRFVSVREDLDVEEADTRERIERLA